MRITELVANDQIDEGIGSMLGKGVGAVAQGLGAAAGAIPGAWERMKKGYAVGKATVAGDDEPAPAPAPAPSGGETGGGETGGKAPHWSDTTPAPAPTPTPAPSGDTSAGNTPAPTPAPAGDVGSIMQAIDKLDPTSKQQLAGELEKSINAAPAPTPGETPAPVKTRTGGKVKGQVSNTPNAIRKREARAAAANTQAAGGNAFGQMAGQLGGSTTSASSTGGTTTQTPTGQVHKANPNNPNNPKKAAPAPTQAEIDADRERLLGPDNGGANESKVVKFKSMFLGMDI